MRVDLPTFGNPTRPMSAMIFSSRKRSLLLARPAGLEFPGGLMRRGGVGGVAPPALAALGREEDLALLQEIVEDLLPAFLPDDGPDRDAQDDVLAPLSLPVAPLAGLAVLGFVDGVEAEIDERIQVRFGDEEDAPAVAAAAAVRPASRHLGFAAEADASVAALSRLDDDMDLIDEQRSPIPPKAGSRPCREPVRAAGHQAGTTATRLPFFPLSSNRTVPVTSAKSVSSLPLPDVRAGLDGRAPLADDDRPRVDLLAAEPLDAEPLGLAVPAVSCRSAFLCAMTYSFALLRLRGRLGLGRRLLPGRRPSRRASSPSSRAGPRLRGRLGRGLLRGRRSLGAAAGFGRGRRRPAVPPWERASCPGRSSRSATLVSCWRWPFVRRYCFLLFFLKMRTLSPLKLAHDLGLDGRVPRRRGSRRGPCPRPRSAGPGRRRPSRPVRRRASRRPGRRLP